LLLFFQALEFRLARAQLVEELPHERRNGSRALGGVDVCTPINLVVQRNCDVLHGLTVSFTGGLRVCGDTVFKSLKGVGIGRVSTCEAHVR
jgi:hypothetical protein